MTGDLEVLTEGLVSDDDGVWLGHAPSSVSYPADAHATRLAIEDQSFWFRHRNRCILAAARRRPPEGTILDIGGGNGFVARGLTAAGFPCAVLEPRINGARAARARGLPLVIHARLEDLDTPACLAAAGLFDVLEHIEDESGALERLRFLLRPGARIYLTVPAYDFLSSTEDTAAGHFRRYTIRSLAATLERAGFELEYATYFFSLLVAPLFFLRTLPSWTGMIRAGDPPHRQLAQHRARGFPEWLIAGLFDWEASRIAASKPIAFGTSCLAIARRP